MDDPEVVLLSGQNIVPTPENTSRKRKKNMQNWKKTIAKKKRHSAVGFPTLPKCGHNEESKSGFSCFRLNMQDVRRFHQGFYRTNIKVEQDQYILRFAKGKLPKRHRLQTPDSTERGMTIEYCMPTYRVEKGSEEIKVCQKNFSGYS